MSIRRIFYPILTGLFMLTVNTIAQTQNPIQIENALQGTRNWQIQPKRAATNRSETNPNFLEAYASATSVEIGEPITFYVNAPGLTPPASTTARIEIYRMGYYGGTGGRLVYTSSNFQVTKQPQPDADHITGLIECNWAASFTWSVPTNTVSGVFLAKIVGEEEDTYSTFVVRDTLRTSDFLMQTAVTTYQAYNIYPGDLGAGVWRSGKSLYAGLSFGPDIPDAPNAQNQDKQARRVSFNRPYFPDNVNIYNSAGQFFVWEYHIVRWLEMKGFDVTYITDVDSDQTNAHFTPGRHKAFLNAGHDEYWSWKMREHITQARDRADQPLHLVFLGSNDCHWQIRLENSSSANTTPANTPGRTITAYKNHATDPIYGDPVKVNDNPQIPSTLEDNYLTTGLWRNNKSFGTQCPSGVSNCYKDAENELKGIMIDLEYDQGFGHFRLHEDRPAWVVNGITDFVFGGLVGYEPERMFDEPQYIYPNRTLVTVAQSPYRRERASNAVYFRMNINNSLRGRVFSVGTNFWAWGLDPFPSNSLDVNFNRHPHWQAYMYNSDVEKITENVLNCFKLGGGAACGE